MERYDIAIIGTGPAGLSAALTAQIRNKKILLLGSAGLSEKLLDMIDVLVDGPFVEELKDITLKFRGSSNQRLLDLKKTREHGKIVMQF